MVESLGGWNQSKCVERAKRSDRSGPRRAHVVASLACYADTICGRPLATEATITYSEGAHR